MIKEWANALGIDQVVIYILIASIFISIVYAYSPKAGLVLGGLAILTIVTTDWKSKVKTPVDISDLMR